MARIKIALRLVTAVLICGLLLSGAVIPSYAIADPSDSALAPPLATKPPCEIVRNPDGSFDVVTNNDVIESWNGETVRNYGQGITASGKAFRNKWAFVDVGYLIGQMLILTQEHKLQNPKDILIPLIKKHIRTRNDEAEILLEGYDINGIEEIRDNDVVTEFSLPVKKNGIPAYKMFFNLSNGDIAIPMNDGATVYVTTELADIYNTIALIRDTWHDLGNQTVFISWLGMYIEKYSKDTTIQNMREQLEDIINRLKDSHESIVETNGTSKRIELEKSISSFTEAAQDLIAIITSEQMALMRKEVSRIEKKELLYTAEEIAKDAKYFDIACQAARLILTGLIIGNDEKKSYVPVSRLIDASISMALPDDMEEKITVNISPDVKDIFCFESKLFRVFLNLLKNSAVATDNAGLVSINISKQGNDVVMRLSDNGCGMPQDKVDNFNTGLPVKSSKGEEGGRGLGIVRSMIQDHGGTISVESPSTSLGTGELGNGTTLAIRLPVVAESKTGGSVAPNELSSSSAVTKSGPIIIYTGDKLQNDFQMPGRLQDKNRYRHDTLDSVLVEVHHKIMRDSIREAAHDVKTKNVVAIFGPAIGLSDIPLDVLQEFNTIVIYDYDLSVLKSAEKAIQENGGFNEKRIIYAMKDITALFADWSRRRNEIIKQVSADEPTEDERNTRIIKEEIRLLTSLQRESVSFSEYSDADFIISANIAGDLHSPFQIERELPRIDGGIDHLVSETDREEFNQCWNKFISFLFGNHIRLLQSMLKKEGRIYFAADVGYFNYEEEAFNVERYKKKGILEGGRIFHNTLERNGSRRYDVQPQELEGYFLKQFPDELEVAETYGWWDWICNRDTRLAFRINAVSLKATTQNAIQPELGKGTTFTLQLPVVNEPSSGQAIRMPMSHRTQSVSADEVRRFMTRKSDGKGVILWWLDCSVEELFGLSQQEDLKGKDVLVLGCGGCVYCFSAVLKGANRAVGVDIDENSIVIAKLLAPFIHNPVLKNGLMEHIPSIDTDNVLKVIKSMSQRPEAKEKLARVEPTNLDFIATDATNLSMLQSNSFDAVAIPFLLATQDGILDEEAIYNVLKEAIRVSKPNGTLFIKPSFSLEDWQGKYVGDIYAMRARDEERKAMFGLIKLLSSLQQEGFGGKRLVRVSDKEHLFRVELTQPEDAGSYIRSSLSGQTGSRGKVVIAPVTISPESERIHATNLQDTLTYIQAQPQTQPLIVVLGTSWIKGYKKGQCLQYDALNPLLTSIRTYYEQKGIPFIVDDDDKLLARITAERAKEGKSGAKVVVLAGKDVVVSDEFTTLRNDQENAFVVGVDNQELTTDSYIRLMEMLTLALKLSAGLEISLDNTHITITKDNELHLYIFLPHAEPMDYERLKVIYEVQKFA